MIPPTMLWLTESVPYLVFMSLYAIIIGEFSAIEATDSIIITQKQIEGEFDDMADEGMVDYLARKREET